MSPFNIGNENVSSNGVYGKYQTFVTRGKTSAQARRSQFTSNTGGQDLNVSIAKEIKALFLDAFKAIRDIFRNKSAVNIEKSFEKVSEKIQSFKNEMKSQLVEGDALLVDEKALSEINKDINQLNEKIDNSKLSNEEKTKHLKTLKTDLDTLKDQIRSNFTIALQSHINNKIPVGDEGNKLGRFVNEEIETQVKVLFKSGQHLGQQSISDKIDSLKEAVQKANQFVLKASQTNVIFKKKSFLENIVRDIQARFQTKNIDFYKQLITDINKNISSGKFESLSVQDTSNLIKMITVYKDEMPTNTLLTNEESTFYQNELRDLINPKFTKKLGVFSLTDLLFNKILDKLEKIEGSSNLPMNQEAASKLKNELRLLQKALEPEELVIFEETINSLNKQIDLSLVINAKKSEMDNPNLVVNAAESSRKFKNIRTNVQNIKKLLSEHHITNKEFLKLIYNQLLKYTSDIHQLSIDKAYKESLITEVLQIAQNMEIKYFPEPFQSLADVPEPAQGLSPTSQNPASRYTEQDIQNTKKDDLTFRAEKIKEIVKEGDIFINKAKNKLAQGVYNDEILGNIISKSNNLINRIEKYMSGDENAPRLKSELNNIKESIRRIKKLSSDMEDSVPQDPLSVPQDPLIEQPLVSNPFMKPSTDQTDPLSKISIYQRRKYEHLKNENLYLRRFIGSNSSQANVEKDILGGEVDSMATTPESSRNPTPTADSGIVQGADSSKNIISPKTIKILEEIHVTEETFSQQISNFKEVLKEILSDSDQDPSIILGSELSPENKIFVKGYQTAIEEFENVQKVLMGKLKLLKDKKTPEEIKEYINDLKDAYLKYLKLLVEVAKFGKETVENKLFDNVTVPKEFIKNKLNNLNLADLNITSIQRAPRWEMLLKTLSDQLPKDENIKELVSQTKDITSQFNLQLKESDKHHIEEDKKAIDLIQKYTDNIKRFDEKNLKKVPGDIRKIMEDCGYINSKEDEIQYRSKELKFNLIAIKNLFNIFEKHSDEKLVRQEAVNILTNLGFWDKSRASDIFNIYNSWSDEDKKILKHFIRIVAKDIHRYQNRTDVNREADLKKLDLILTVFPDALAESNQIPFLLLKLIEYRNEIKKSLVEPKILNQKDDKFRVINPQVSINMLLALKGIDISNLRRNVNQLLSLAGVFDGNSKESNLFHKIYLRLDEDDKKKIDNFIRIAAEHYLDFELNGIATKNERIKKEMKNKLQVILDFYPDALKSNEIKGQLITHRKMLEIMLKN